MNPSAAPVFKTVLKVALRVEDHQADLRALLRRYRNRPLSLPDACLVRLSELHPDSVIFTLDTDFKIQHRCGNKIIPVLMLGNN